MTEQKRTAKVRPQVEPKHQDPLGQLADNLGVPRRPKAPWWLFKIILLVAPLLAMTAIGMTLSGAWQALVFTFVGATASVQAAGPYSHLVDLVGEPIKDMEDSSYSIGTGVTTLVRFWWRPSRYMAFVPVGPRRVFEPLLRWQYRRRYRQMERYFFLIEGRVLMPTSTDPGPAIVPRPLTDKAWFMTARTWRWYQRSALRRLGRDLIRSTGNTSEDVAVAYHAELFDIPYSKPCTAYKRTRRHPVLALGKGENPTERRFACTSGKR